LEISCGKLLIADIQKLPGARRQGVREKKMLEVGGKTDEKQLDRLTQ
jgi:hypothetical protein